MAHARHARDRLAGPRVRLCARARHRDLRAPPARRMAPALPHHQPAGVSADLFGLSRRRRRGARQGGGDRAAEAGGRRARDACRRNGQCAGLRASRARRHDRQRRGRTTRPRRHKPRHDRPDACGARGSARHGTRHGSCRRRVLLSHGRHRAGLARRAGRAIPPAAGGTAKGVCRSPCARLGQRRATALPLPPAAEEGDDVTVRRTARAGTDSSCARLHRRTVRADRRDKRPRPHPAAGRQDCSRPHRRSTFRRAHTAPGCRG